MSHEALNLPIAFPFVPPQMFENRYSDEDAMQRGTLFPELDLPFKDFEIPRTLPKTPLTEIMTLDFVAHELRLFLDTHPDDKTAMHMYKEYRAKAAAAKEAYKTALSREHCNYWVYSPWPWEGEV